MFSLQIVSILFTSSQILTAAGTEPCPSPAATERCPQAWQLWGSSCYRLNPPATWEQTELACRKLGGKIASPQSLAENDFFLRLAPDQYEIIHIGCDDRLNESAWICEGVQAVNAFVNWMDGAPDGGIYENCAELLRNYDGKWQDRWCNKGASPGICKRSIIATCTRSRTFAFAVNEAGVPLKSCLLDHVIQEFPTLSIIRCASACLQAPQCRSFNFKKNDGGKICQLNNSTCAEDPGKFAEIEVLCTYADVSPE